MKRVIKYCPNCGKEFSTDEQYCSACGSLLAYAEQTQTKKSGIRRIMLVLLFLVLFAGGLFVYNEYKKAKFQNDCYDLVMGMLDGMVVAEDTSNDIIEIWYNSIWKVDDSKTNRYTLDENGYFYDDFNDALNKYASSATYEQNIKSIFSCIDTASTSMSKIRGSVPKGFERMYNDVEDYFDLFLEFVNLPIDVNESYNTYVEKFNNLEDRSATKIEKIFTYFK